MSRFTVIGLLLAVLIGGSVFASSVENELAKAKALFDQGKYQEAVQAYKNILSTYKNELKKDNALAAKAWQGLGEAFLRAGKPKEAQKAFERVGAHQKRNIELSGESGSEKTPTSNTEITTPSVNASVGPELPDCKNQEVKEMYKNAFGFIQTGGQKIIAIRTLLDACQKEPNHPVLLTKTAELILDTTETFYKDARKMMEKVYEIKKDNMTEEERILLARSWYVCQPFKFEQAEKILNEILKVNADNVAAKVALGELNLNRGKFQEAIKYFSEAKQRDPKNIRASWGLGWAIWGTGNEQEALQAFRDAYDIDSADPIQNVRMGKAMFAMGKKNVAVTFYQQALDRDPNCYEAHLAIIPIHLETGRDFTARRCLDIVMAIDPQNPDLYLYQGIWSEMRGNIIKAIENYEYSAQFTTQASIDARLRLARIYMGIGHRFLGKGFSNDNPVVRQLYLRFYKPERALNLLREVVALAPNHPEMEFISNSIGELEEKIQSIPKIE